MIRRHLGKSATLDWRPCWIRELVTSQPSRRKESGAAERKYYTYTDLCITPTPRQMKWIKAAAKYQGMKGNSTIDQRKTDVETNNRFEVLTSLNRNFDSNPTLLEMKSHLNSITIIIP